MITIFRWTLILSLIVLCIWMASTHTCRPAIIHNVGTICFPTLPFFITSCYATVHSKDGKLIQIAQFLKRDAVEGKEINYCFKK